jgi:hypothetical protein
MAAHRPVDALRVAVQDEASQGRAMTARRTVVVLAVAVALFAVLFLVTGCTTAPAAGHLAPSVTTPTASSPSATTPIATSPSATPPPPLQVHDPGQVTGTLTGPCHTQDGGQLPDPNCTPGAYDPAITAAVLCAPGYSTRTYRAPSSQTSAFKWNVAEPAYGEVNVSGELDHLVSLELGGANDASNLWVEPGPIPNPKDNVENQLHAAVCAGKVTLRAAQDAIAGDWMTAEQVLGLGT